MVSSGLSGHPRTAGLRESYLIALTLLFGLVGCSGRAAFVPDRSQDARIQQQVVARLAAEPGLRPNSIRVEVDGGTVMLHGAVRGIGEWQCALTNAELVSGVRTVADFLVLERGARTIDCLAPRADSATVTEIR